MKKSHQIKKAAREAQQERHARRVVNGIFIGLIVIMLVAVTGMYLYLG